MRGAGGNLRPYRNRMSGKMPTFTDQCGERTWCKLVGYVRGRPKSHLDNKVSTLRGFERINATLEAPLVPLTRDTLGRMRLKFLSVSGKAQRLEKENAAEKMV